MSPKFLKSYSTIFVYSILASCISLATLDHAAAKSLISLEKTATPERIPLQKGMPYSKARQLLLQQGWQPNLRGDPPNLQAVVVRELYDLGYKEIKDCAGTGEGLCLFEFVNQRGKVLSVVAAPAQSATVKWSVRRWWIESPIGTPRQSASSPKIAEGYYSLGGTDEGLEVKGNQYRYFDELDANKPWHPISELKFVKEGVVFDGKRYWCLATQNPGRACSKNGWVTQATPETLPFVGTRRFNFLGGSGTGQSVAIDEEGTRSSCYMEPCKVLSSIKESSQIQ